jgi:GST-like protein
MVKANHILYGAEGSGAVAVEAALTLAGLAYEVIEADGDVVDRINPMRQVPALILPSGEVMTESAAILIWLAESHPEAGLGPAVGAPERARFLRWMAYVSAQIYALYWLRDEPSRLVEDAGQQAVLKTRAQARIVHCWGEMEQQVAPGPWLLGERLSVLDLYVTVVSRWSPGRRRFHEVAPRMGEVVRRVDAEPRLAELWARRFPFEAGWEG